MGILDFFKAVNKRAAVQSEPGLLTAEELEFLQNFETEFYGEEENFDYDTVRDIFEQYSFEDLLIFSEQKVGSRLGPLTLLKAADCPRSVVFAIAGHKAVWFETDISDVLPSQAAYFYIQPAMSDGPGSYSSGWPWFGLIWRQDDSAEAKLAVGGVSDFYERYGVWPHYRSKSDKPQFKDKLFPLAYTAEIDVLGKRAYMFEDVDTKYYFEEDASYPDFFDISEAGYEKGASCVLLEDNFSIPAWIEMLPLDTDMPLYHAKRYVPVSKLPYGPVWLQGGLIPPAPYNKYVIEVPPIQYDEAGTHRFDLPYTGDFGCWYIFWDGIKDFRVIYQQF